MDRLNVFNNYKSKGEWHEDQLTRAYLVVVKNVPLAMSVFLDLVRETQRRQESASLLPSLTELLTLTISVHTQRTSIPQTTGRLVSVVMTDEYWTPEHAVENSERGARYDGILCFDPDWIIVIENKPLSSNIWSEQVNPNLADDSEIDIGSNEKAVGLRWSDVVKRLNALLNVNALGKAERQLVEDFLELVDDHFKYLNPFDTIGQCKDSRSLLERRCRRILESIAPERVKYQRDWPSWYIELVPHYPTKMCGLYPKQTDDKVSGIELAMYPGDTMNQARTLFKYLAGNGDDRLLNLRNLGYTVKPNFHFSFIRRGLGHGVNTALSLTEYLHYWMPPRTIDQILPNNRGFESQLRHFVDSRLIAEEDVPKICAQSADLGANVLNVIPGVQILFTWTLADAAAMDRLGSMVNEVRQRANEILATWGGELLGGLMNSERL